MRVAFGFGVAGARGGSRGVGRLRIERGTGELGFGIEFEELKSDESPVRLMDEGRLDAGDAKGSDEEDACDLEEPEVCAVSGRSSLLFVGSLTSVMVGREKTSDKAGGKGLIRFEVGGSYIRVWHISSLHPRDRCQGSGCRGEKIENRMAGSDEKVTDTSRHNLALCTLYILLPRPRFSCSMLLSIGEGDREARDTGEPDIIVYVGRRKECEERLRLAARPRDGPQN